MRKLVITLLLAGFVSLPLAAEEKQPREDKAIAAEGHQAFEKAREEHRAKMKATQEKMEKLVKEYNKLKAGKKKDAKRAEIEKEVAAIHEEQLKFKAQQLAKFEERLAAMKAGLAAETSAEGKKAWVDQKTNQLIEKEGDLKALFEPREGKGPHMGGRMHGPKGPHMDGRGPHFGKGPRPADERPVLPPPAKEAK